MRFVYKSLIVYFIAWAAFSNPCLAQTTDPGSSSSVAVSTGSTAGTTGVVVTSGTAAVPTTGGTTTTTTSGTSSVAVTSSSTSAAGAPAGGDIVCDPDIQASQAEIREMVIESKKESIKAGMKASGKKIGDFSCLKDLWGGFGGGIDIMALLMQALAALRDAACAAASSALSGVTGGVNAMVQDRRDDLIKMVNDHLMAQATALTADLQNDLNALEEMTSEESIQKRADGLTGPYTEKVEKDYELMLYD